MTTLTYRTTLSTLIAAFAAIVAFLFFAPMTAGAAINQQLDPGESGPDVVELQEFLAQDPDIYPEGLVTGYYGELTVAAVQRYQCDRAIVCSGTTSTTGYGRVGPITRTAINAEIEGDGTGGIGGDGLINQELDFGERGPDVIDLQRFLAQDPDIYPQGLITGYYGSLTTAAVRRYQCDRGIVCSGTYSTTGWGRVGPETRAEINAEIQDGDGGTGGPALIDQHLDPGETGQDVLDLQRFLADDPEIYPEGLVTGYYGELTVAAVQRYQCDRNIVCSGTSRTTGYGRVGPVTRASINAEILNAGGN